jgi:hypothetical protein
VLVLKKYLALPTPDKSTSSKVVCHFCETGIVAKKMLITANKKNPEMLISIS